jgi:hypothetical protein
MKLGSPAPGYRATAGTLARSTNGQLFAMLGEAYTTDMEEAIAAGNDPSILVLNDSITEQVGWAHTVLKTPGYLPTNLQPPRRRVILASTEANLIPVMAGLRPTFVEAATNDVYPGFRQGFWPMWQITDDWVQKLGEYQWSSTSTGLRR